MIETSLLSSGIHYLEQVYLALCASFIVGIKLHEIGGPAIIMSCVKVTISDKETR